MFTEFGKILRILRIERGEILRDMAKKLGVTSAYLSAVEIGKRNIPVEWVEQISELYNLDDSQQSALQLSADASGRSIHINMEGASTYQKQAAVCLARNFRDLDEQTAKNVISFLDKSRKE